MMPVGTHGQRLKWGEQVAAAMVRPATTAVHGPRESRTAVSPGGEVRYFASKHGLSSDQVLDLIKQFGNDRKTLESKVASIKGPTPA
jgi:hypothetical protein